jgi:hypothetical protein
MRTAYVRVELGDAGEADGARFIVSPVPFVWHCGNILIPSKSEQRYAASHAELCSILTEEFQIPESLLPPNKYFRRSRAEKEAERSDVYRTVPEGTGEPAWRMDARQAMIEILESDETIFEEGRVVINDLVCYSIEDLRQQLKQIVEQSGRKPWPGDGAYQPDYDPLLTEILQGYSAILSHTGLSKRRRNR